MARPFQSFLINTHWQNCKPFRDKYHSSLFYPHHKVTKCAFNQLKLACKIAVEIVNWRENIGHHGNDFPLDMTNTIANEHRVKEAKIYCPLLRNHGNPPAMETFSKFYTSNKWKPSPIRDWPRFSGQATTFQKLWPGEWNWSCQFSSWYRGLHMERLCTEMFFKARGVQVNSYRLLIKWK